MTHPDVPSLVERLNENELIAGRLATLKFNSCTCEGLHGDGQHNAGCPTDIIATACAALRDTATQLSALETSHAAARSNFLTMQNAAAELLKRAERAEEQLKAAREEKQAVITLLYTDEVFVGSHWEQFPDAEKGLWPALCVHASSYGADGEEIPADQILPLATLVEQFGRDAIQAWVCYRRGIDKPGKGSLSENGQQALESLRARTALSPVNTKGGGENG